MATQATPGYPVLIKLGNGASPDVFTAIAEVRDIKGPGVKADIDDVTNHDSANGWEEVISTILRSGMVTFPVNYIMNDATQNHETGLLYLLVNRIRRNYQIVNPDATVGGSITFPALVVEFDAEWPVAKANTCQFGLKVTGEPIFDAVGL